MASQKFEMYMLILKTLEGGPYVEVAKKLRREMEQNLNETRLDYLGQPHPADLNNLLARYPYLTSATLEKMCQNLKYILDKHMPPSVPGVNSYLGTGQFSLLRNPELLHKEDLHNSVKLLLSNKQYGSAFKNHSINVLNHLHARKTRAMVHIKRSLPTELYARTNLYRKIMGHLSSVYCVCFDQSGQFIFTGADDHLIKIWSAHDGRLVRTLRGHDGEITDMSVNFENRLLASGGMDRVIRIWDLKTSKLLDCLNSHSAMVTSVKFAPYNRHGKDRYLISTSNDGSVIFWSYHVDKFEFKRLKRFQERNRPGGRIVCSSFSTGGSFLACGSSDNFIHVYGFHPDMGPYWISELDYHTDQVDSIQFSNQGFRFITGSQDGTAVIWTYKGGRWKPLKLDMRTQLDQTIPPEPSDQTKAKPRVLIVQWSRDDRYVMTTIVDYSIKVWDSKTGRLVHILKEHLHDVYLIESHPTDPRIFISASHDGTMIIWDIERAKVLKKFSNKVESGEARDAPLASIYDIKFSPDGNMIAATDSYGYLTLFGNGSAESYKHIPEQMFFHTDYRALIRDLRHFVMDEQTHVAPHLMPRPTLVDMNGNPYPQNYQRFVPDYRDGERVVVPPLSDAQISTISEVIVNHSKQEDEEYINEKKSPPDDLLRLSGASGDSSSNFNDRNGGQHQSVYNTRYSTRSSFQSARSNFMPRSRRTRQSVRYYEDDDDEQYQAQGSGRGRRHRQAQPIPSRPQSNILQMRLRRDSTTEEEDDDDETESNSTDTSETEIDESDDETVIDSEATEIDDTLISEHRRPTQSPHRKQTARRGRVGGSSIAHTSRESEGVVRRCSARLRERGSATARKRFRRS